MAVRFKALKNMEPYAFIRLVWPETDSFKLKCRGRCEYLLIFQEDGAVVMFPLRLRILE